MSQKNGPRKADRREALLGVVLSQRCPVLTERKKAVVAGDGVLFVCSIAQETATLLTSFSLDETRTALEGSSFYSKHPHVWSLSSGFRL